MKLSESISKLGQDNAIAIAAQLSVQLKINWDNEVQYLFRVIATDVHRVHGNIGDKVMIKFAYRLGISAENMTQHRVGQLLLPRKLKFCMIFKSTRYALFGFKNQTDFAI